MAGCGCSHTPNPLSHGCSTKARSKNIGTLIREGYDPKQAAAIAYGTQRKSGCKVPRRKLKKNPPYTVFSVRERKLRRYEDLAEAISFARRVTDPNDPIYDKLVVYDAGRTDRGPKGEFIAMFRPNKKKVRRSKARKNPGEMSWGTLVGSLLGVTTGVLILASLGDPDFLNIWPGPVKKHA